MKDKTLEERIKDLDAEIFLWLKEAGKSNCVELALKDLQEAKGIIEELQAENKELRITIETSKALEQIGLNERLLKVNEDFALENKELKEKLSDERKFSRNLKKFIESYKDEILFPDSELNKVCFDDKNKHYCALCDIEFFPLTESPLKYCSVDCEKESESKASEKLPEVGKRYKTLGGDCILRIMEPCEKNTYRLYFQRDDGSIYKEHGIDFKNVEEIEEQLKVTFNGVGSITTKGLDRIKEQPAQE